MTSSREKEGMLAEGVILSRGDDQVWGECLANSKYEPAERLKCLKGS
jgi:hypothetical protein